MTPDPRETPLDTLLLDADPVDVLRLRDLAGADAALGLRDAIMRDAGPATWLRRHRRFTVAAGIAIAAAVAGTIAWFAVTPPPPPETFAAHVTQFAQHSPRLLLRGTGWRVTDVNEEADDEGQTEFVLNGHPFEVRWDSPAWELMSNKQDLATVLYTTADGRRVWYGPESATGPGHRYYFAGWAEGNLGIEVLGEFRDPQLLVDILHRLHHVGFTQWLAALPPDVVTPTGRRAAVDGMLADIPQPPGFDRTKLYSSPLLLDRYQLGVAVTEAVDCEWLGRWLHGSGDERRSASAAMATSRRWAILREMTRTGEYPSEVWSVADVMNGGSGGGLFGPPTPGETTAEIAKNHLGC